MHSSSQVAFNQTSNCNIINPHLMILKIHLNIQKKFQGRVQDQDKAQGCGILILQSMNQCQISIAKV